jgi:hypothetical protein
MATIKARKQANGTIRYTAVVRMRRGTTVLHRETKTFAHRSAAISWAKHREVELENPGALTRMQHGAPTLAELIRWYIDTFETISKWRRSKQTPSGVPRASCNRQGQCADAHFGRAD